MRIVVQRVSSAQVIVNQQSIGAIKKGLLVFLGITHDDTSEDVQWLVNKLVHLRIFDDQTGVMNTSLKDIDGQLLVVSQFTLHALTKKGNRPSYLKAAKHEKAIPLYEAFIGKAQTQLNHKVQTGSFGAMMDVELTNDGPVTILIDSKNKE